ncbi:MFS transporter [Kutzneria sp. NPDC052558]|uniref:MFS transporter n=1 Tax=Kutzneria sp. NPDC052558 TaxID=3364121 RepID=UPI0037CBC530
MRSGAYRQVLAVRGLRSVLLLSLLAKLGVVAVPIVLTLHVTAGLGRGFGLAGVTTAAWTVGVALGSPVQGRVLDRHGARRLFAVATVGQGLFWGLAPLLPYPALLPAAFASGLVLVPGTTVSRLAIANLVAEERRHTAFVVDSMLTNLSYMTGPALGVLLATRVSTTVALLALGAVLVLSGAAVIAANPPLAASGVGGPSDRRPPRRWLTGGLAAALACALAAGLTSSGTEIAVIGSFRHMNQVGWTSVAMVLFAAGSMVGGLAYGGLRRGWSGSVLVAVLGLATVPLGLLDAPLSLTVALLPAALLYAPAFAATAADASRHAVDGTRGVVMSVYSTAMTVGTAAGGPLAGAVVDTSDPAAAFAVIGGLTALVAVLSRWAAARFATAATPPSEHLNTGSL